MGKNAVNTAMIVTVFAVLFFQWYFAAIWTATIDPVLKYRDPCNYPQDAGPLESFWYWKDLFTYLSTFLLTSTVQNFIPFHYRTAKATALTASAMVLIGIVSFFYDGNFSITIVKPATVLTAMAYTGFVAWNFWQPPHRYRIERGRVYKFVRPPRSMVEFLGSWIIPRWAGSISLYCDGIEYGFSRRTGRFVRRQIPLIRSGIVAQEVGLTPSQLADNAEKYLNSPWRWNCFRVINKIIQGK